jgi:hypothetical protein
LAGSSSEAHCNEPAWGDKIDNSEDENHEQTNPREPSNL